MPCEFRTPNPNLVMVTGYEYHIIIMFVYGMHTAQNMEVYKHISTIICNREVGSIIIKIWTRVISV